MSCVLVYKVLEHKSPQYLYNMFRSDYTRDTRQAAKLEIRQEGVTPDLDLMMDSFRWRAAKGYNQLPVANRKMKTL